MPNNAIIGQRRQGKSTLALAVAALKSNTIVVFDPNFNYRMPGAISVRTPSHMIELMDATEDAEKLYVFRIGPFAADEIDEAFSNYSEVLYGYEDFAIIVDESHMLQGRGKIHPSLDRWLRRSPASVHVIQTSHRFMELNQLSRYLVDEVRMFRNEQPRETDLLEDQLGIQAELMRNLGDRHYVRWYRNEVGTGKHYVQHDSQSWFIDLRNPNSRS